MSIPVILARALLLTAEQYIRRAGGWQFAVPIDIARKLYDNARPGSRYTRREYGAIARQAIRDAEAAEQLVKGYLTRKTALPTMPGIRDDEPDLAFRVIVAAKDQTGNEIFSTAVWVRSTGFLTKQEIEDEAINSIWRIPSPNMRQFLEQMVVSYETWIQLAGRK